MVETLVDSEFLLESVESVAFAEKSTRYNLAGILLICSGDSHLHNNRRAPAAKQANDLIFTEKPRHFDLAEGGREAERL
jgi:hypothetical protein